jgi:predicted O-methyltransferase YrrM
VPTPIDPPGPPPDYESIRARVEAVEGFMVPGQERYLFEKVLSLPDDAVVLEIGSYKGRSTVAMAHACIGTNRRIYCVDTWDGNDKDFPERNFFQVWEAAVNASGLRQYVHPLRGLSHDILRRWPELAANRPVDFAFIDGSHEYHDVLEDLRLTWPLVKDGGWISFHDVHHTWPGPKRVWFDVAKRSLDNHEYASTLACGQKPPGGTLAEPAQRSTAAYEIPSADGGPAIHFFTLALDAEPFVRRDLEQLARLPFTWHWHLVEGVTGTHPAGDATRSIDGTTDYLDRIQRDYPDHVTVYRKPPGRHWQDVADAANMPLWALGESCLLWRINPDELWTVDQISAARRLFLDHAEKTAAFYWCWLFVAPGLVTSTRHSYGNDPRAGDGLRTWRYHPGMWWGGADAPVLAEPLASGQWRPVHTLNPLTHDQTEAAGCVFQRYAFVTESQVQREAARRGLTGNGVIGRWHALQRAEQFPVKLSAYFPWVADETEVDRAEYYVANPLLPLPAPAT